jgi:hypothetical protein
MKVRMKAIMAGPDRRADVGQVIEVTEGEAKDLIDGGFAEPVAEPHAAAEDALTPEHGEPRSGGPDPGSIPTAHPPKVDKPHGAKK